MKKEVGQACQMLLIGQVGWGRKADWWTWLPGGPQQSAAKLHDDRFKAELETSAAASI